MIKLEVLKYTEIESVRYFDAVKILRERGTMKKSSYTRHWIVTLGASTVSGITTSYSSRM